MSFLSVKEVDELGGRQVSIDIRMATNNICTSQHEYVKKILSPLGTSRKHLSDHHVISRRSVYLVTPRISVFVSGLKYGRYTGHETSDGAPLEWAVHPQLVRHNIDTAIGVRQCSIFE